MGVAEECACAHGARDIPVLTDGSRERRALLHREEAERVRQYTGGTLDKEEVASPSTYYGKTWENESLLFFSSVSVFVGDTGACHYDNDWTLHRSLLLLHLSNVRCCSVDIVVA